MLSLPLRVCCVAMLWGLLASCQPNEHPVDRSTLRGTDYRLFQGTPLWEVAQAAQANDAQRLTVLGTAGGLHLDAPEPRFGKTVLMLAVANGDYAVCQTLLRLGAGPNVHDHYNGAAAPFTTRRRDSTPHASARAPTTTPHSAAPRPARVPRRR